MPRHDCQRVRHVYGIAMHGCQRVRHIYGSPCTVADVFCTSTAHHCLLPTGTARLRLVVLGCRRVRHIYGSPGTMSMFNFCVSIVTINMARRETMRYTTNCEIAHLLLNPCNQR
ncbi:unnamed protein product [Heligmosomoides polygyrus]|uniref:Phlebovirus glycoprotein G2 fusion domain-containing protein n=1 Tax=Heligmosomoides polygyrus TaxID=6339 RepID=A0A183FH75_HELPZ|nr:unnamed protein product [Heligmosomoides polygyrus]